MGAGAPPFRYWMTARSSPDTYPSGPLTTSILSFPSDLTPIADSSVRTVPDALSLTLTITSRAPIAPAASAAPSSTR